MTFPPIVRILAATARLGMAALFVCALAAFPGHAAPRPAVAFVHLLLPPDDERAPELAGWIRSHDLARDMLESRRIPTIVFSASAEGGGELQEVLALKPEILVTTSPRLYAAARAAARDHPDTLFFACTDEPVDGNLSGYQARTYEAHYLAGLAAGSLSKGVLGYVANDPSQTEAAHRRNANAFTLGAQAAQPGIRVLRASGADAKDALSTMIAAGADIINIERTRASLLAPLREHGIRYVGFAPTVEDPLFLTTPEWNWGTAFGDLLAQVRFGTWRPRHVSYGIREGVVKLSPFGPTVPQEVRERVRKAEQAIRKGASPFRGPVSDAAERLRIPEGADPKEDTLRSMNWDVRGLEALPTAPGR